MKNPTAKEIHREKLRRRMTVLGDLRPLVMGLRVRLASTGPLDRHEKIHQAELEAHNDALAFLHEGIQSAHRELHAVGRKAKR